MTKNFNFISIAKELKLKVKELISTLGELTEENLVGESFLLSPHSNSLNRVFIILSSVSV